MGLIFVLFFSIVVAVSVDDSSKNNQKEKITQVSLSKTTDKKSSVLEVPVKPEKPEPVKEEVKPEPVKEEVKPEPVKEEVKPEPVKEEVKPEPVKEEVKSNESEIGWFKIVLYILGPILIIIAGKNIYSRLRNNSTSSSPTNYFRKEFREEAQPDTTEQKPAEEEAQPDTTEQKPAEEEAQPDTTEQKPAEEDENSNK
jgi:ATP-dependent Zn protease